MSNVVRSIFRQREIEMIYTIETDYMAAYKKEKMIPDRQLEAKADKKNFILSDKLIGEYDIEIPMLEVGEEFFLSNIGKSIKIKSRMRSSDGFITYYAEDIFVETERTKKSYEYCADKIARYDEYKEECEKLKEAFYKYKKEYKYKNKYLNFDFD